MRHIFLFKFARRDDAVVENDLALGWGDKTDRGKKLLNFCNRVIPTLGSGHEKYRMRGDSQRPGLLAIEMAIVDGDEPARRKRCEGFLQEELHSRGIPIVQGV